MYCVMAPFGVFVCSTCAGFHREMNHKVKGISMSVFTEQEIAFLAENGNKVTHPSLPLVVESARQTHEGVERQEGRCA